MKIFKKFFVFSFIFLLGFAFTVSLTSAATPTPTPTSVASPTPSPTQSPSPTPQPTAAAPTPTDVIRNASPDTTYIAEVIAAREVESFSYIDNSNTQLITIEIQSGNKVGTTIDTFLTFPNTQFQEPLKVGERIIIGSVGDISSSEDIIVISKYRQNNLLVWAFILIGIFLLVSGFRANIKYLQIFVITIISGALVLLLYHKNTYLVFGLLFAWQLIATAFFAYRIFRARTSSIIISLSIFINQLIILGIIFIMKNIQLYDTGFFDLFFSSSYDARSVMIFILGILALYPISVVFAEQVVSESIKKKREEQDIPRIKLIQFASKSALKTLNNIYLTFFGLFFAVFTAVIAIASRDGYVFEVLNTSTLSQFVSVGFLILLDLLIFIPLVSFIAGIWLGKLETHQLVTDRNVRQLEL